MTLSAVRSDKQVKHFKIHQVDDANFHVEHKHQFCSLIDLVEHYCVKSLNNTGPLGNPCKRVRQDVLVIL